MKERIKNLLKERYTLILLLIITAQIIFMAYLFDTKKQGFHSDELWNYGFANSSDTTHIYSNRDGEMINFYKWTDSDVLLDYIAVNKGEQFSYNHAYINASNDINPPLQYMLLHTICSFFPGKWSKWYGFAANVIAFIIMQIYLFRLINSITKNKLLALCGVTLFGFGIGAINIMMFIRIYSLGVALGVAFAYYTSELYNNRDNPEKHMPLIIKAIITCFLGCFTLHQFMLLAFAITLCYSLIYLFTKHYKLMFKFGFAMLAAVGLTMLLFPSTIKDVFLSTKNYNYSQKMYPAKWQFKIYWAFMTTDVFGIGNSIWPTMTMTYVCIALVILAIIIALCCFLFRKDEWFKNLVKRFKTGCVSLWQSRRNFPFAIVSLLGCVTFIAYISANRTSIFSMGIYSRRYIFLTHPLLISVAICAVYFILGIFIKRKYIRNAVAIVLTAIVLITNHTLSIPSFYFEQAEEGITFKDIEEDANIIIVLSDNWILTAATSELYNTGNFYATNVSLYDNSCNNYSEGLDPSKPLYLLVDNSAAVETESVTLIGGAKVSTSVVMPFILDMDKLLDFYKKQDFTTKCEYVGMDCIFDRTLEIYRLN